MKSLKRARNDPHSYLARLASETQFQSQTDQQKTGESASATPSPKSVKSHLTQGRSRTFSAPSGGSDSGSGSTSSRSSSGGGGNGSSSRGGSGSPGG